MSTHIPILQRYLQSSHYVSTMLGNSDETNITLTKSIQYIVSIKAVDVNHIEESIT